MKLICKCGNVLQFVPTEDMLGNTTICTYDGNIELSFADIMGVNVCGIHCKNCGKKITVGEKDEQ